MNVILRDDIEQIGEEELQRLLLQLPSWRLERTLKIKHLEGRRESAVAFLLLADALRAAHGITSVPPFSYTELGKPFLADFPHFFFNLSHCRNAVLCAVHDAPVGADVERIREVRPSLVRYTMNEAEQNEIFNASQPDLAFTRLWTRKEALLKLTGEGVGSQMHDILLPEHLQEQGITIETYVMPNYVYSIAKKDTPS